MAERYSITRDPSRALIRYRLEGFWNVENVDEFCAALKIEVETMTRTGRTPHVLGDARDFAVQSASVSGAFEKAMMRDIVPRVGRLAILVSSMLSKLQVERDAVAPTTQVFQNETDALAWLEAGTATT